MTPNKKVLIIEDEQAIAEMYKMQFEIAGYQVDTANDGLAGFEKAREIDPDLIILDVIMPRANGYQILKKLRSDDATRNKIICFLSNLDNQPEVEKGLSAGADAYFTKSANTPGQLIMQINSIVSRQEK